MSARRQFATLKIIYFIFFEVGPLVSRGRENLIEIMVAENHIEEKTGELLSQCRNHKEGNIEDHDMDQENSQVIMSWPKGLPFLCLQEEVLPYTMDVDRPEVPGRQVRYLSVFQIFPPVNEICLFASVSIVS